MASSKRNPGLLGSIEALTLALDARDSHTRWHCDRVVRLAADLGEACGVGSGDLEHLEVAARFHDIGKIGVPDAVLLKPARLDEAEWELMKSHSVHGERIFKAAQLADHKKVSLVIRHHHEAYDGSGYPDGLCGDDIPLCSRILLVVDAYDAMASARPYHKARSHAQIMGIMASESEHKLDPAIFATFSKLIDTSPSRVQ